MQNISNPLSRGVYLRVLYTASSSVWGILEEEQYLFFQYFLLLQNGENLSISAF